MALEVTDLPPDRIDEAVDVLSDAFFDYPVMRFVIGEAGSAYAQHLRTLIHFFTTARFVRNDLVMGVTAALAGVVAGLVMDGFGYAALTVFAGLLVTGVATAAELARRTVGRSAGSVSGPLL